MSDPLDALLSQPSAATGAAGADPYGALLGVDTTQQRLKSTLNLAVDVAPDQAAQQRKTAQQLGTPVAAVEALPEDAKRAAAVQAVDTNTANAPVLRKKYTEADFAKLAHDDSGVLANLESMVGSLGSAARYLVSADDNRGLVNDIKAGFINTESSASALFRAATELPAPLLDFLEADPLKGSKDWRTAIGGNPLRRLSEGFAAIAQERAATGKAAGSEMGEGNLGQGVASGVQSLTQNLLMLPAALLTGGETAVLAGMSALAGGSSYEKAREAGVNPYSAALYGTSDALIEFATERLPMHQLLGDLKAGTPFLKTLLHNAAREIPGEQIATFLQDANEWATLHPEKSVRDYLRDRPDAAVQTLIATLIGTGGQVTLMHAVQQAANNVNGQMQQVHEAEQFGTSLEQMLAAAGTSKLRERAPDAFAATIQQMADETGGAPSAVYADARLLSETLAQSGMSLEQLAQSMPDTVASLREALAQNGTVTIPMGELMATAPGTPLEQALVPILRQSAEGLSPAEAKEAGQQAETFIKDQAGRVMEQAEQRQVADQQTAEIKQTITEQLNAAKRFRPEANQLYATMIGAFYGTMAQRMGVTPAELYAKYPLRVTGQMQAGQLEQSQRFTEDNRLSNLRADGPAWQRIRESNPALAAVKSPDGEVTIYRATVGDNIRPDDFVAVDKSTLTAELENVRERDGPTAKIIEQRVKVRDLLMGNDATEFVYYPASGAVDETLAQKTRATFSPEQMLIALGPNADYSSFLHESGHAFLEILNDLATQPDAPEQVAKDWQTTLDWFGVTPEAWAGMSLDEKRPYHERWAESTEQYFFEGKAPSVELRGVFDRFRTWLMSVYKSLKNFAAGRPALGLSDEIRQVMDRLLATDEQIAAAEQVRQYGLLFKSPEEAGMTPEQWVKYTSDDAKAHAEAMTDLSKRSLRDMAIVTRKRMKALREVQADMAEKRKAVEKEAAAEIDATPIEKAKRALKEAAQPSDAYRAEAKAWAESRKQAAAQAEQDVKAELLAANPNVKGIEKGQLIAKSKRDMANEAERRVLQWEKQNPKPRAPVADVDMAAIADAYGFASVEELQRELVSGFSRKESIEGLTDRMMLERYGDLSQPRGMERAADEAVHNENRARVLAAEMAAVNQANNARAPTASGKTVNAMVAAAKQFAARLVESRKVKDLKPQLHTAAETRAARAAEKALAKGDTQGVIVAKRDQLLNFHAAKATTEAQAEATKIGAFFEKITKAKDDVVGKTRDLDVVKAAQAILAAYGLTSESKGKAAVDYVAVLEKNDPAMFAAVKPSIDAALAGAKPVGELTMGELRALNEEVQALWYLAKRSRQMEIDGNLLDRQEIEDELKARMQEIGIPDSMPGDTSAITPREQLALKLKTFVATARRVESWAQAMDGLTKLGSFRRFVWQPVKEAATQYHKTKGAALAQFKALLDPVADSFTRSQIEAPELNYTFGKDTDGVAMSELLHAILHTGNESNKRKMLLGRKWATENTDGTLDTAKWDAFVARLVKDGTLTVKHFDTVQAVWDLMETLKPAAQKAHRDVFGRYFAEVTADKFTDPFGIERRGGYIPAMADSRIVSDMATRRLMEDENNSMQFAFPTTSKGFTKSRVEYNRPLLLDMRSLTQHIDKVLLFSHMEVPVREVRRVLTAKGVAYGLNRIEPAAFDRILTPWLNRAAKQAVETPVPGTFGSSRFWTVVRQRAGMAAMFFNVANAVQQLAGFSLAAVKVSPAKMLKATAQYTAGPKQMAEAVAAKSDFMQTRMSEQVSKMTFAIENILADPTTVNKSKRFLQRHAYFVQQAIDNVMGPIIWTAAYNQALEEGHEDKDAVRLADSAIRETQQSTAPEEVSAIEAGTPFERMFMQFAGYFNMQANLLGTEFKVLARDLGLRKGLGRGLYVLVFGFLVNAWVAEAIMQAFKGGPDDEDKDGHYLNDWLKQVFGWSLFRNVAAMVPFVGQATNALVNTFNSKPYDDRISSAPAISMIESAVKAPDDVYKAVVEKKDVKPGTIIRDVATLITMLTGIPLSAAARPVGYLADVNAGKVHPTSPADAARGVVTGTASPPSKH